MASPEHCRLRPLPAGSGLHIARKLWQCGAVWREPGGLPGSQLSAQIGLQQAQVCAGGHAWLTQLLCSHERWCEHLQCSLSGLVCIHGGDTDCKHPTQLNVCQSIVLAHPVIPLRKLNNPFSAQCHNEQPSMVQDWGCDACRGQDSWTQRPSLGCTCWSTQCRSLRRMSLGTSCLPSHWATMAGERSASIDSCGKHAALGRGWF